MLDDHIREGNSVIGPDFFNLTLAKYTEEKKERVNVFDWEVEFADVFERGGFDCVVGNPPYVKLQNFRKAHDDMARHLSRAPDNGGVYQSTQTGNFDLYLPFIEKGIHLLNEDGYLGYIAPSVWTMNEYGAGLRATLEEGRNLWGWIDFGSFQVFEEATTYTALQFFSRSANEQIAVVRAWNGVIGESPWGTENITLSYDRLTFSERWLLETGPERDLIDKLTETSLRLDDRKLTDGINQGLVTSADRIYHLKRLGVNRYEQRPPKGEKTGRVVTIEDEIMKPLASGPDVKRYLTPMIDVSLLFPYRPLWGRIRLIPAGIIQAEYPHAWAYLIANERDLRERENHKMDVDDRWWGYVYPKNLDKQEIPKLLVASTVRTMQVSADYSGRFYVNNVRVNSIVPADDFSISFLLAALNGKVANFVFRRTAKPKDNGYFEANKQFIVYLPIPDASREDRETLAHCGERLQSLYSQRRELFSDVAGRMNAIRIRRKPEKWLFPNLPDIGELAEQAPKRFVSSDRLEWANERREREVAAQYMALEERLTPGVALSADLRRGELRFFVDGIPVISGIFLPPELAPFVLAQWRVLAGRLEVTARTTGMKFASELRKVSMSADAHIMAEVIDLENLISIIENEIAGLEDRINQTLYRLHGLTPDEVAMIENADR